MRLTAFTWRYAADYFSTVFDRLLRMERTIFTSETLYQYFGIFID